MVLRKQVIWLLKGVWKEKECGSVSLCCLCGVHVCLIYFKVGLLGVFLRKKKEDFPPWLFHCVRYPSKRDDESRFKSVPAPQVAEAEGRGAGVLHWSQRGLRGRSSSSSQRVSLPGASAHRMTQLLGSSVNYGRMGHSTARNKSSALVRSRWLESMLLLAGGKLVCFSSR